MESFSIQLKEAIVNNDFFIRGTYALLKELILYWRNLNFTLYLLEPGRKPPYKKLY